LLKSLKKKNRRRTTLGEKKKIVIAEDQTLLREGLRSFLSSFDDFEVVGEAEDGLDALRCVKDCKPDLILLDLAMPKMNGLPAIPEIKTISPETKVLVVTIHKTEQYVLETFRSGADGYILKDCTHAELLTAIKSILSGTPYISPGISGKILEGYLMGRKSVDVSSSWDALTSRERQVLKLIGEGYKHKEIAEMLHISVKTVDKHRANIIEKLDLHSASTLTAYAIEKGLVTKK
jgi:DNA-binding NarL/FixJ family response regulator